MKTNPVYATAGKALKPNRDRDVLYMHADDELTPKALGGSGLDGAGLRESLATHLLFFGRALVPLPFVLDNPELTALFRGGERSDAYRLIEKGHVLPVMHGGTFTSVREYARAAIERKMLIHIPKEEFQYRAGLIDKLLRIYVPDLDFREGFKKSFFDLTKLTDIDTNKAATPVPPSIAALEDSDRLLTRTNIYDETKDFEEPLRNRLRTLVDTAYYCAYADGLGVNPAVPEHCAAPTLANYHKSGGPLFDSPTAEDRPFMVDIPDFSHIPLADLLEDLGDSQERKTWLATLRKIQTGRKTIEMEAIREKARALTNEVVTYVTESVPSRRRSRNKIVKRHKFKRVIFERFDFARGLVLPTVALSISIASNQTGATTSKVSVASLVVSLGWHLIKDSVKRHLLRMPAPKNCIPAVRSFSMRARGLRE